MDSQAFSIGIVAVSASAAFIVWAIANAVTRLRSPHPPPVAPELEARLARIETAIEAIAIEVERAGELQRFAARLGQPAAPAEASLISRPVTPH